VGCISACPVPGAAFPPPVISGDTISPFVFLEFHSHLHSYLFVPGVLPPLPIPTSVMEVHSWNFLFTFYVSTTLFIVLLEVHSLFLEALTCCLHSQMPGLGTWCSWATGGNFCILFWAWKVFWHVSAVWSRSLFYRWNAPATCHRFLGTGVPPFYWVFST